MFSSAWLALAAASSTPAAAACTAFTEADIRAIAERSASALLLDDTTTHRRGWLDFQDGFPCLEDQLPKEAWAGLLVSEAIVRNALGENWLEPLDTALTVWPAVPGIPKFLMEQYTGAPSSQPLANRVVRPGATLFVDGVLLGVPPRLTGLHAVQLLENGAWTNRILTGDPLPPEWLISNEAPSEPALAPIQGRGSLSAAVGLGSVNQSVAEPGTWLGDTAQTGVLLGVTLVGAEPIPGLGGFCIGWDIRGAAQVASVLRLSDGNNVFSPSPAAVPDLYGAAGWMGRGWAINAGAGASRLWVTTGGIAVPYFYPQPHIGVDFFGPRADFGFGGGATPSASHFRMHTGNAVTASNGTGLRLGADFSGMVAWFDEVPPGARSATVVSFGLAGTIGIAWGLTERPGR